MPYKVKKQGDKYVVYKKDTGKRVGATAGNKEALRKYLAALHLNANESLESIDEESKGLWANIRAKQARGEKSASKGSEAYNKAVTAAKKIKTVKNKTTLSEVKQKLAMQKHAGVISEDQYEKRLKLVEDESSDLLATVAAPYEDFVAKLGSNISDPKIQAILMKGKEDGQPADEVIKLTDADIPVQKLQPTQNEIALDKSLIYPLTDVKSAEVCLKGGVVAIAGKRIITANGIYVVDGHHRWSQLYAMNKDASIATTNMTSAVIKQPLDFLKVTQAAIAADLKKVPTATAKGSINLITISEDQLKTFVIATITDPVLDVFKKYKKGDTKEAAANYIWSNVQSMQSTSKPVSGAPKRDVMPQTDDATKWQDIAKSGDLNFMPPFKLKTAAPVAESVHKTVTKMLNEAIKNKK